MGRMKLLETLSLIRCDLGEGVETHNGIQLYVDPSITQLKNLTEKYALRGIYVDGHTYFWDAYDSVHIDMYIHITNDFNHAYWTDEQHDAFMESTFVLTSESLADDEMSTDWNLEERPVVWRDVRLSMNDGAAQSPLLQLILQRAKQKVRESEHTVYESLETISLNQFRNAIQKNDDLQEEIVDLQNEDPTWSLEKKMNEILQYGDNLKRQLGPGPYRVYRGVGGTYSDAEKNVHWTLSRDTAVEFAQNYHQNTLVTAEIRSGQVDWPATILRGYFWDERELSILPDAWPKILRRETNVLETIREIETNISSISLTYAENPSAQEIAGFLRDSREETLRGVYMKGSTYWWDAHEGTHDWAVIQLHSQGIRFNKSVTGFGVGHADAYLVLSTTMEGLIAADANPKDAVQIGPYVLSWSSLSYDLPTDGPFAVMLRGLSRMKLHENKLDVPTPNVEEIARKHKVSPASIRAQLQKGMKVELEHTKHQEVAREIALDHLNEFPDYYDRLEKVEETVVQEALAWERFWFKPDRGFITWMGNDNSDPAIHHFSYAMARPEIFGDAENLFELGWSRGVYQQGIVYLNYDLPVPDETVQKALLACQKRYRPRLGYQVDIAFENGEELVGMFDPTTMIRYARTGERPQQLSESALTRSGGIFTLTEQNALAQLGGRSDIPNENWLKTKQDYADEDAREARKRGRTVGFTPNGFSGTVTANIYVWLPTALVAELPGLNGEHLPGSEQRGRGVKARQLAPSMKHGYSLPKGGPVFVVVNHHGEAWIAEGNNRTALALKNQFEEIPVNVRYFNGGERADGPMSPERLVKFHPRVMED